jgi:hypothetical protein
VNELDMRRASSYFCLLGIYMTFFILEGLVVFDIFRKVHILTILEGLSIIDGSIYLNERASSGIQ